MTVDHLVNQKIAQRHMQGNWQRLMFISRRPLLYQWLLYMGFNYPISYRGPVLGKLSPDSGLGAVRTPAGGDFRWSEASLATTPAASSCCSGERTH